MNAEPTTPRPESPAEQFRNRREARQAELGRQRFRSSFLGVLLGFAIWFGVQYFSELDNFDYNINATYFIVLYGTGFALGLIRKTHPLLTSFAMATSQIVAYVLYPNTKDELGNVFPFVAAMLFACALPTVGMTLAATRLRRALARRSTAD